MTKQQLEDLYNEFIHHITPGYAKMLWKSPHSITFFMRNRPEILAFEIKQKW